MSEPTERDRESAEWLRDRAGLLVDGNEPWIKAAIEIIATARAEERERIAALADEWEYKFFAARIRSGQ